MAKRKRLTPFAETPASPHEEESPMFPTYPLGYAGHGTRSAPIADMAGAAAATAAMEEMAETLRAARDGGRMVLALPLSQVEAGHLVRDRIAADPDEMAALVESLRARGQQSPIEVVALGPDRYGLISGWRRLTALRQLLAETGDAAKFGSVLALLRKPDQASDAYVAMVEENEIRVGLSFYERARIVAKAVEAGVFADDRAALRALFAAASRAKRSKIGSFLAVVRALDGTLRFPEAIGERLGLQLAQAIEADAGLGPRLAQGLAQGLRADPPADGAAEQARLARLMARPAAAKPTPAAPPGPARQIGALTLRLGPGSRIVIEGQGADEALLARLDDWLRGLG